MQHFVHARVSACSSGTSGFVVKNGIVAGIFNAPDLARSCKRLAWKGIVIQLTGASKFFVRTMAVREKIAMHFRKRSAIDNKDPGSIIHRLRILNIIPL